MKKNKKKKNNKKLLIIILFIVFIIGITTYIGISRYLLYKTVIVNRTDWDIFVTMNTPVSGDYMGKIYEKDYKVTELTEDIISI